MSPPSRAFAPECRRALQAPLPRAFLRMENKSCGTSSDRDSQEEPRRRCRPHFSFELPAKSCLLPCRGRTACRGGAGDRLSLWESEAISPEAVCGHVARDRAGHHRACAECPREFPDPPRDEAGDFRSRATVRTRENCLHYRRPLLLAREELRLLFPSGGADTQRRTRREIGRAHV